MTSFLGRYSSYTYALFRIVTGFLFMLHGTQKLFNWPPADKAGELGTLLLIAGIIELVGGAMVMFGFFASIAAFVSSGTMAVAYFMAHQPMGLLPITNRGELAALYCFAFLYIASKGSGLWSIDSIFRGSSATSGD
jgi:putative oxidoreductase